MKSIIRIFVPLLPIATIAALGIGWTVSASATTPQQLSNYHNDDWHFSINVPAEMKLSDTENQGDAQTLQFSDGTPDHTFEIVASPYTQMDVALGEEGTLVDSTDQGTDLGIINVFHDDTYSVAFHRKGVEYTITTTADNETWLLPIIQSWEFTN
jgi:hypothetical protein